MQEVERAENAHEPVKPVESVLVYICAGEPRPPLRHAVHDRNDRRAQVIPHRQRGPGQRRGERSHLRRSLREEKLEQPREREQVRRAQEEVLQRDPQERDRQRFVIWIMKVNKMINRLNLFTILED